jgi:hypothetical protein
MKHLYGISGQEEILALNQFFPDLKKEEDKYPEDVDDADCNLDEDDRFNETEWLEEGASSTYGEI